MAVVHSKSASPACIGIEFQVVLLPGFAVKATKSVQKAKFNWLDGTIYVTVLL